MRARKKVKPLKNPGTAMEEEPTPQLTRIVSFRGVAAVLKRATIPYR
jgi:hypothetical protein